MRRSSRVALLLIAIVSLGAAQQTGSPPADGTAWFCPMHPEVTASETGRCRKCGMALVQGDPFDTREYAVELSTMPAAITPGVPTRLTFTVHRPGGSEVVTRFETV